MNERPLTSGDVAAVVAMVREEEEAVLGIASHVEKRDVEEWLARSDLAVDSWLFEENGAALAAGWFTPYGDHGVFSGIVAQGAMGRGLGTAIVERGEAAARSRGFERVQTWALAQDGSAAALFGARGYRGVRRFYDMVIELTAEPYVPEVAEPLLLDVFRDEDAHAFHAAMIESFQDHWDWHGPSFDEWWEFRGGDDRSLWFVVRDGDELAAIARNALRDSGGYVGLLGVRRPWRGRGLAKALLFHTFAEFWRRGLRRVSLGVDAESPTGATKLYESVGMRVELESTVYEKGLA